MRTSKSSLLAALVAALCLSLVGATGAHAATSFDGYVDLDSRCDRTAKSNEVTGYLSTYERGRQLDFSGHEPTIRTRPVGTTTTTPAWQYVRVRWGMRHWDYMGPGKPYDEWNGWKLARANRFGTYEQFALGKTRKGRNSFRWNGKVNGKRLKRGTYLLTYRALRGARIVSTSGSIRFAVTDRGRIRGVRRVR